MIVNGCEPLSSEELDARFDRWSSWARTPIAGSLSSKVTYMSEHLDPAADSDEMTEEIVVTERAIGRTKMEDKVYWDVIEGFYIRRLSLTQSALFFNVPYYDFKSLFNYAKSRVGWHIYEIEREA